MTFSWSWTLSCRYMRTFKQRIGFEIYFEKTQTFTSEVPHLVGCHRTHWFLFYAGNINQLILKMDSYSRVLKKTRGIVAEFVNPKYADSSKKSFKSPTRLECMMQDYPLALPPTANVGFTVINQVKAPLIILCLLINICKLHVHLTVWIMTILSATWLNLLWLHCIPLVHLINNNIVSYVFHLTHDSIITDTNFRLACTITQLANISVCWGLRTKSLIIDSWLNDCLVGKKNRDPSSIELDQQLSSLVLPIKIHVCFAY